MNKTLYITLSSFALVFTLTGCSNGLLYQVGQDYQKSECINNAKSGTEHQACMEKQHKPFEEYEKERELILKEDKEEQGTF